MSDRIVYAYVRIRIEGRAIVTGPPLRRMSKCLLCGLDSGPLAHAPGRRGVRAAAPDQPTPHAGCDLVSALSAVLAVAVVLILTTRDGGRP